MGQNDNPFFLLTESLPDAIYISVRGDFAYLNPAALKLFGAMSADQLLGQPILERIHPKDRSLVAERIEQVTDRKESVPLLEMTYLQLDGTPVEIEASAVPFQYQDQDGGLVFVRDVTKRKAGEQALKALNRDFVTLLENTSDFIYFKDQNSRFRFCSQTLANITGHPDWRDMIGKHDLEVFPEDTAKIYYEEELPIFNKGIPLLDKVDPYYDEHGRPGWVNTNKWPVFDDDGKSVVGIFGISRIVTERVRAEAEQQRLKRTLQLLNDLNSLVLRAEQESKLLKDVCQFIVEQGGYLMAWVGFALSDVEQTVRPVASSDDLAGYLANIRKSQKVVPLEIGLAKMAMETGRMQIVQDASVLPCRTPAQDVLVKQGFRSVIALPLSVDGLILGALAIHAQEPGAFSTEEANLLQKLANNLAAGIDRLRAKVRLAHANKELQAFTYAASHDLKAPLARINSFSTLLERSCRDRLDGEALQFLDFIRQNATRLTVLVDDLLAHAQLEQQTFDAQIVDLKLILDGVLTELAEEIQQKGVEVRTEVASVLVRADHQSLLQALRNLLANAIKYSSQATPPRVEIGGEFLGNRYRLWIRDNGIGFDMVYHDRIFEIFRRLHTYSEYPGNGVGLALVKKAVESMQGRVWAESSPGQGATFFLELEAATDSLAA